MDDNVETVDVESEAIALGWSPREKWRGDPENWIDAETFLRRGKEILPLLKASNKKLEDNLRAIQNENSFLHSSLEEMRSNMAEFASSQREMLKNRLEEQRKELLAQRKVAREEGDDEILDGIEQQLDENREAAKKLESSPSSVRVKEPPEFLAWRSANSWFEGESEDDVMLTALAFRYGQEAAKKGLTNSAFYSYIDQKLAPRLRKAPPADKTESGGSVGVSGGKGYNALPPDARAICDADEKRFVGPNKMFKTREEWRTHFISQYF